MYDDDNISNAWHDTDLLRFVSIYKNHLAFKFYKIESTNFRTLNYGMLVDRPKSVYELFINSQGPFKRGLGVEGSDESVHYSYFQNFFSIHLCVQSGLKIVFFVLQTPKQIKKNFAKLLPHNVRSFCHITTLNGQIDVFQKFCIKHSNVSDIACEFKLLLAEI